MRRVITIEPFVEDLRKLKVKLEQALMNGEPVKLLRPGKDYVLNPGVHGMQEIPLDEEGIRKQIAEVESEIEWQGLTERERLNKATMVLRDEGIDEYFRLKFSEQELQDSQELIKAGKQKEVSNIKRSKAMKGKKYKECPIDFFHVDEIAQMLKRVNPKRKSDIGLFLVHGNKDFQLQLYSAESLKNAFHHSYGIVIQKRTWQKWKSKKYSKYSRARKAQFSKKFTGF